MKYIHKTKQSRGFTLIELLFSTAILGFMLSMTVITFIGVFRFYIWSGTIRTNQSSARELMDTITREIASKKIQEAPVNSICLVNPSEPSPSTSVQIRHVGSRVERVEYTSSANCLGLAGTTVIISNPKLNVIELKFAKINGAINNDYSSSDSKKVLVHSSATINMTIVNGFLDSTTGKCRPNDNFCDIANYSTAVTERNNGL